MLSAIPTVIAICLVLYVESRMKKRGRQAGSVIGRLGLVLNWGATLFAVLLFGLGWLQLINAKGPDISENTWLAVALLWGGAFCVWLLGKAIRFVLTGPLPEHTSEAPLQQLSRNSLSIPLAPYRPATRAPWGDRPQA